MEILKNIKDCTGCHACYQICPVNAIEMKEDESGFLYPHIDPGKCIECGRCRKVCPLATQPESHYYDSAYGAYASDPEVHLNSSSGAIFFLLAEYMIRNDGVVFGAALDNDLVLRHHCADNLTDLEKLRKTKYVQSEIGNSYSLARQYLQKGIQVLFSGTPCQIAGLKAFLGQEYSNLVCMDLICHGVPSPSVFRRYCDEVSEKKVRDVDFRNKRDGIKNPRLVYTLSGGECVEESCSESPYIQGFLKNLYLRDCCCNCQFKGYSRCSDITIGDFWSCSEFYPELNSDLGTSSVLIYSQKGKECFDRIKPELTYKEVDGKKFQVWNECLVEASRRNKKSIQFEEALKSKTVHEALGMFLVTENTCGKAKFWNLIKLKLSEKFKGR